MELKSIESESKIEVLRKDGNEIIVKHHPSGNICAIQDTFAEMFPMWSGRILISAATEEWALTSARVATGFASSIIMSPAEAGIEKTVQPSETPDGRPGVIIQIFHNLGYKLKAQMMLRIGQCILTCPTTAAFDAMGEAFSKKLKIGKTLSLFGDGYQTRDTLGSRRVWRIPVMEGEFIVEEKFGVKKGVAGGNFLILAQNPKTGLTAAEKAVQAINKVEDVILPFPGGICKSGSKVGSLKYKLPASTNHLFCPTLKTTVPATKIPSEVNCVYEIVINGLYLEAVQKAVGEGVKAAISIPGIAKITAANYGGRLGPYRANLKEVLNLA
ncbi:MAG: formylmethanofuran--tetrahydromethanopterin N-formyltransferase [Candidatus Bathyarchaeota archaeon]|nr:MAG: formylmethanofuran--tetrahydromethanopterin N-formyltransferase [Candidatus Bathyarchaeota archaeon]